MIKYLAKFVKEERHATMLKAGQLFMRPSSYYMPHKGEKEGQKDKNEGAVRYDVQLWKGRNFPIFCLYAIDDTNIDNNNIAHINTQCIYDFECQNGYLLLIDYHEFINKLDKKIEGINTDHAYEYGKVKYTEKIDRDSFKRYMTTNETTLFNKMCKFAHQNEFRIVIYESMDTNGKERRDHKVYSFKSEFKNACLFSLAGIDLSRDTFELEISSMVNTQK